MRRNPRWESPGGVPCIDTCDSKSGSPSRRGQWDQEISLPVWSGSLGTVSPSGSSPLFDLGAENVLVYHNLGCCPHCSLKHEIPDGLRSCGPSYDPSRAACGGLRGLVCNIVDSSFWSGAVVSVCGNTSNNDGNWGLQFLLYLGAPDGLVFYKKIVP